MPKYDYRCPENGQVIEVKHGMNDQVATWGELCACAGLEVGSTSPQSPVERLITGGYVVSRGALKNPEPSCSTGSCCSGGMCGFN
ncbi:MAG: regulator [Beggiatoa sp. IS2]|nr:MAG: regulator [Beggiatoa sp. IS2]